MKAIVFMKPSMAAASMSYFPVNSRRPSSITALIQIPGAAVSLRVMAFLLRDLRVAFRTLIRRPGFTTVTVSIFALGIGLTSGVLELVRGVLLTPPPYPHAERFVCVSCAKTGQHDNGRCPAAGWVAWRNEAKSFEALGAYRWTFDYLVRPDGSQMIQGMDVTTSYFVLIGIKPLLGRTFLPSEIAAKPDPVIILGYDLWQKSFGGDQHIIGQTFHISRNDGPVTIIGVMPPGLRFLPAANDANEPNYNVNARVDYWRPARLDESKLKEEQCEVVGRLRGGVKPAQARAELTAIANRHAREDEVSESITVSTQPLTTVLNREGQRLLLPLLGAVALLFLIACSNVAALLLARGLQRQQEWTVRRALGAQRAQLLSLTIAEPLLLSLFGGALGVGVALALVKIITTMGGAAIPRLDAVTVGWPVIASCFGLALAAAACAGLLPAIRVCRLDGSFGIKSGGRTGTMGRAERGLLAGVTVLQFTLTLALLVGAALLIRTVGNLTKVNPGYDTRNILTMSVTTMLDGDDYINFHVRALERISALPGVTNAAFTWGLPLTGNKWTGAVTVEGQPKPDRFGDNPDVAERAVTPEYFETLRIPIVAGRGFRSTDNWNNWNLTNKSVAAPGDTPFVAIINQAMAKQLFGNVNPVGKKLHCNFWDRRTAEIIGVANDVRNEALAKKADPEIYFSFWQIPAFTKHLIVKAATDPRLLRAAVERELRALDPKAAIDHVKTLDQIRDETMASQKFAMRLLLGFALVGTVLALVGIHSVLSLSVGTRRREIAIRMAMGAQRDHVRRLILREGWTLTAVGLIAGTGLALALGRGLRAFLFGVEPTDPLTFAGAIILFATVSLVVCCFPAWRGTKTDPVMALRYD